MHKLYDTLFYWAIYCSIITNEWINKAHELAEDIRKQQNR